MTRVNEIPEWATPVSSTLPPVHPSTRPNRCRTCGLEMHYAATVGGYDTHPSCDRRYL
jgi:hypothetical protein